MEFTRSYGFNSHLLSTYRLGERDLANVMRSRALREREALRELEVLLPQLKKEAADQYSLITIQQNETEYKGWVLATYQQRQESKAQFIAVAMDEDGKLWVGVPKYPGRTVAVKGDYEAPSVSTLTARYQELGDDPTRPLVNDQDNEYVAATLQDPSRAYAVQLHHTLHPHI